MQLTRVSVVGLYLLYNPASMDFDVFALDRLGLKYSVRDPIHGFIRFNEWEKSIIDHPWFQRLRRIRQLAFTEYIYPGASHTRFEHSLGVMHLATRMFLSVTSRCRKELVEDVLEYTGNSWSQYQLDILRTAQLLRFAALLHDIGHGPFSHAVEAVYPEVPDAGDGRRYKHEDYSVAAIEHLGELIDHSCYNRFREQPIQAREVSALLKPHHDPEYSGSRLWRLAREIVSSQLDADKFDYLLRDSYYTGVAYGLFDLERAIESLSFCLERRRHEGEATSTVEICLALDEGDKEAAASVVAARAKMFSQVYMHKTRRMFDLMLGQAMLRLEKRGMPPPDTRMQLVHYFGRDDTSVIRELLSKREYRSLPLVRAIQHRDFPRVAGTIHDTAKTESIRHAVEKAGLLVVTDSDLQEKYDQEADVWIDTGAKFRTYKLDPMEEIKLRPTCCPSDPGLDWVHRYRCTRLSDADPSMLFADLLKKPRYRVYSTKVKRKRVADVIQRFGEEAEPWEP